MTAISVSERLLEMAAFYTWLDFTLTLPYIAYSRRNEIVPSRDTSRDGTIIIRL